MPLAPVPANNRDSALKSNESLADIIDDFHSHGEAEALVQLHRQEVDRYSYEQLGGRALALARGLAAVRENRRRIGLFAEPGFASMAAALGIIRAGCSVVLVDVQLADSELADIIADSDCRLMFTTRRHADRLQEAKDDIDLALMDVEDDDESSWRRFLSDDGDLPDIGEEDEAALFYTSGTTGPPKGVPLSHKNLLFQVETVAATELVEQGDRVMLPLPLHHVYPFVIGMLVPLSLGLAIVLPASMTGPQILRAMDEGAVSAVIGVPRLYKAMVDGIRSRFSAKGDFPAAIFDRLLAMAVFLEKRNIPLGRPLFAPLRSKVGSALEILASGGSPLDPELAWKLRALGWKVAIGYGLTETSPLLTINLPESKKLESIGRPIDGVELRFDPESLPQTEKQDKSPKRPQRGELLAKGPGVFSGYLNLPEKTEEDLEDGWFRTGDLGYEDEEGFIYVTGRVSTLIVTEGGENVQPDRIEEVLAEHRFIKEAGVLAREGGLGALIVPDPAEIGKDEVTGIEEAVGRAVEESSGNLASYERIAEYYIVRDSLPRTRLGKIKRHLLEQRFEKAKDQEDQPQPGPMDEAEMSEEDTKLLAEDEVKQVWKLLAKRFQTKRLTPDTSFQLDLGVDSLEWLNLTMEIRERAGIEIGEEAIARIEVVRDLLEEVQQASGGEIEPASLDDPEESLSDEQEKYLRPPGSFVNAAAALLYWVNRIIMRSVFRLRVEGVENIEGEGLVFAPNHVSYLDPFVLAAALPKERLERTYWTGLRGAAFHNPFNAMVSRMAKTIPVDPEKGAFSALIASAAVLERGKNLIWFAEGGRSSSGELQPLRQGIGVLLKHSRSSVVPVSIRGTFQAMPVGRILPRPARITVIFGTPLTPAELDEQGEGERSRGKITDGLQAALASLQEQRK